MKKSIQIVTLLIVSLFVIAMAIRVGEKHSDCRECAVAISSNP